MGTPRRHVRNRLVIRGTPFTTYRVRVLAYCVGPCKAAIVPADPGEPPRMAWKPTGPTAGTGFTGAARLCIPCGDALHAALDALATAPASAGTHVIMCCDEPGHGNVGLWWKPGAAGYTRDLDAAGRWPEAEARRMARDRDLVLEFAPLSALAHRVVDLDRIDGAHAAIRAARSVLDRGG